MPHPSEELIGKVFTDIVHADDQQDVARMFAEIVRTPGARGSLVCRVGLEGRTRWCEGAGVNMLDVEGVEGVVLIARDITERRELEERVEPGKLDRRAAFLPKPFAAEELMSVAAAFS